MKKQSKKDKQQRKSKHKKRFRVIVEIVLMALGVLCSIMPQPFPLLVPIVIGTVRIISNAVKKEEEPPQPVVYCNGVQAPSTSDELIKEQKANVKTKKTRTEAVGAGVQKTIKKGG